MIRESKMDTKMNYHKYYQFAKYKVIGNILYRKEIFGTFYEIGEYIETYDGSDAYDDIDIAIQNLPGIYDDQIKAIKTVFTNLKL
jgi:hypothetical protein